MTAAALKRGGTPKARAPRRRVKRTPWMKRLAAALPIDVRMIERIITTMIVVIVIGGIVLIAAMLDVPRRVGMAAGEAVGRAGFTVKQVDVTGIDRMDRQSVYAVALDQQSIAMPLVDLEAVRERLLRYGWVDVGGQRVARGWVADARVSRRLPDTLAIEIVERKPAALWQHSRQLILVDDKGVELEPVRLDAVPDLPRVIGPGANTEVGALNALLVSAARLRPVVDAATWVGGRRWDLRFRSGETLMLPEGDAAARAALVRFAELDRNQRLLGQKVARFDLRIEGKMAITPGVRAVKPVVGNGRGDKPTTTAKLDPKLSI